MQGYQGFLQLTDAVDIRLHFFLPKNVIYLFNLSHLIGGDGFLCTDVIGDISRHAAEMEYLELLSAIAQMLTAGGVCQAIREYISQVKHF